MSSGASPRRGGEAVSVAETPDQLVHLSGRTRLVMAGVSRVARALGLWRRPRDTSGDLEQMTFLDKAHWMHKARHPVLLPQRPQRPEAFHLAERAAEGLLPPGFEVRERLTLAAVGDLMPHPWLERSPALYDAVAPLLAGAALRMANLESPCRPGGVASEPLDSAYVRAPVLALTPAEIERALGPAGARFTHVSLANNHALDEGVAGLEAARSTLAALGVTPLGIHPDAGADALPPPVVFARGGLRVGLVTFTFGLNGRHAPPGRDGLVQVARLNAAPEHADLERVRQAVSRCREAGADLVVAYLHWGLEFELFPSRRQQRVARALGELGCDVVLSHHPHVIQPIELFRPRRAPERTVPICYSLGNLVVPLRAPIYALSLVVRITLARGVREGRPETHVERVDPHPVYLTADDERETLRLVPLADLRATEPDAYRDALAVVRRVLGPASAARLG